MEEGECSFSQMQLFVNCCTITQLYQRGMALEVLSTSTSVSLSTELFTVVHIFRPVPAPSFQSRQRIEQDCARPSSLHSLVTVVSWNPSSQLSCRMLGPHTSVMLCRIMGPHTTVLSCRMLVPHLTCAAQNGPCIAVLSCRMLGPHTLLVLRRIMGPCTAVLSCRMLGPHTSLVLHRIMGPRTAVLSCRMLGPSSSAVSCRMLGPHISVVLCRIMGPHAAVLSCRMLGPSTSALSLQNVEAPTSQLCPGIQHLTCVTKCSGFGPTTWLGHAEYSGPAPELCLVT